MVDILYGVSCWRRACSCAESPVVFLHVGIEVGEVGDAKACHGLADVLLGGRVDEALACTEAEVAGVTEVVLQGLAQGIGLVYGEAREHLHEAAGIAYLRGRMEHGAVALCGGEVGGVDDGDGLLVGRQHLQGYTAQALGSTWAVCFDTQAEGLGHGAK